MPEKLCPSKKEAGKRHPRFSLLSLLPSPCAQTCQEARGQKSSGDTVGRVGLLDGSDENGEWTRGRGAGAEPLLKGLHRLPYSAGTLATLMLMGNAVPKCSLILGRAQTPRAPQVWQRTSHTPTLSLSVESSPEAKWKWLLDYPPFGWIICTIASVHYWGEPGGVWTVLGVPG